jgi:N-terminal domain on NACHT_NTPase and P-loop NTPases
MVFDPFTAIGLASSIVQFIDFSFKIVSKASEIKQSADGVLSENFDLEIVTKDLVVINARLKDSLQPPKVAIVLIQEQRRIYDLRERCNEVAEELLNALDKLKAKGSQGRWKSLRQALKSVWDRDKIIDIQSRLTGLREELELRVLVDMK